MVISPIIAFWPFVFTPISEISQAAASHLLRLASFFSQLCDRHLRLDVYIFSPEAVLRSCVLAQYEGPPYPPFQESLSTLSLPSLPQLT